MKDEKLARRKQREFLFVLDSESREATGKAISAYAKPNNILQSSDTDQEEAKTLRQKLINELREFGS